MKVCETCSATFRVPPFRKDTARFCSRACKSANAVYRAVQSERQQGEKSWRWAGGRYVQNDGYVRMKQRKNAVEVARGEHRLVVIDWMREKDPCHPFLVMVDGVTRLHPDVEVHHIDRDRANNARENLLAVTKLAHARIHHRGTKPNPWECWPPDPNRW